MRVRRSGPMRGQPEIFEGREEAMAEKIEQEARPLEQIYCPRCYLATPVWRAKCIHCQAKLEARPQPQFREQAAEQRAEAA